VTDIENSGGGAHGHVFINRAAVLNGHFPAAEFDHSSAKTAVRGIEGCPFQFSHWSGRRFPFEEKQRVYWLISFGKAP
jgi:hypothetical protein